MKKKYRIEVEVELEEQDQHRVIEAAKRISDQDDDDEYAPDLQEAVADLMLANESLRKVGIEITSVISEPVLVQPEQESVEPKEDLAQTDDLDEIEAGVYLCRWPNGDFSVVKADTQREASLLLDELGAAQPSFLYPMETCLIDFALNDSGEISLSRFGEETTEFIWEKCYPELDRVLSSDEALATADAGYSEDVKEQIRKAVTRERTRLLGNQPALEAETEVGRRLQETMDVAGPVADHYVRDVSKEILKSKRGEGGKPN